MSIFTRTLATLSSQPRAASLADVPRWPDWLTPDDVLGRCARGRAIEVLKHGPVVPGAVAVANTDLWRNDGSLAPAYFVHPALDDSQPVDPELLWNVAVGLAPPTDDDEPSVDPAELRLRAALADDHSRAAAVPIPLARTYGVPLFVSVTLIDALLLPTQSAKGRLIPAALSPYGPPVLAPKSWWARDWVDAYELLAAV